MTSLVCWTWNGVEVHDECASSLCVSLREANCCAIVRRCRSAVTGTRSDRTRSRRRMDRISPVEVTRTFSRPPSNWESGSTRPSHPRRSGRMRSPLNITRARGAGAPTSTAETALHWIAKGCALPMKTRRTGWTSASKCGTGERTAVGVASACSSASSS